MNIRETKLQTSLLLLLLSISLLFSGQQLIQLQSSLPIKNDPEPVLVRGIADQGVYVHDMAFSSGSFYSLTENIEDVFFANPFITNFQNALYMRDSDFSTKWETGLFPTSSETVVNVTTEQIETSRRYTTILACNGDFCIVSTETRMEIDYQVEPKSGLTDLMYNEITIISSEEGNIISQEKISHKFPLFNLNGSQRNILTYKKGYIQNSHIIIPFILEVTGFENRRPVFEWTQAGLIDLNIETGDYIIIQIELNDEQLEVSEFDEILSLNTSFESSKSHDKTILINVLIHFIDGSTDEFGRLLKKYSILYFSHQLGTNTLDKDITKSHNIDACSTIVDRSVASDCEAIISDTQSFDQVIQIVDGTDPVTYESFSNGQITQTWKLPRSGALIDYNPQSFSTKIDRQVYILDDRVIFSALEYPNVNGSIGEPKLLLGYIASGEKNTTFLNIDDLGNPITDLNGHPIADIRADDIILIDRGFAHSFQTDDSTFAFVTLDQILMYNQSSEGENMASLYPIYNVYLLSFLEDKTFLDLETIIDFGFRSLLILSPILIIYFIKFRYRMTARDQNNEIYPKF